MMLAPREFFYLFEDRDDPLAKDDVEELIAFVAEDPTEEAG